MTINALGNKAQRARKVLDYCLAQGGLDDVASYCLEALSGHARNTDETESDNGSIGFVYLVQHGSRREYKIGMTKNLLRREGEIRFELPEKITPVFTIKTDDPAGVEAYWHQRFRAKRCKNENGEWFKLSPQDIRAFRRWKKIY